MKLFKSLKLSYVRHVTLIRFVVTLLFAFLILNFVSFEFEVPDSSTAVAGEVVLRGAFRYEDSVRFPRVFSIVLVTIELRDSFSAASPARQQLMATASQVCVDAIWFAAGSGMQISESGNFLTAGQAYQAGRRAWGDREGEPCLAVIGPAALSFQSLDEANGVFEVSIPAETFRSYPFDGMFLSSFSQVRLAFYDADGLLLGEETVAPAVDLYDLSDTYPFYEFQKYQLISHPTPFELQVGPDYESFDLAVAEENVYVFQRPLQIRLLVSAAFVSMLAFVLLLSFINNLTTLMEVSVAIFLGLWGLRQVLLPNAPENLSFSLDDYLLGVYLLFAVVFIASFFLVLVRDEAAEDLEEEAVQED